jgi:DNA polymerase-3 subunit gamma/tau
VKPADASPPGPAIPAEAGAGRPVVADDAAERQAAAPIDTAEWDRLVSALPLTGMARQLAVNCVFQDRDARSVTLRIDTAHRDLVTEQGVKRLETALSQYYDESLRVRIRVGGLDAETPAKRAAARDEARLARAREAIAEDPNVRAFGELFDAEVKPESIEPLD